MYLVYHRNILLIFFCSIFTIFVVPEHANAQNSLETLPVLQRVLLVGDSQTAGAFGRAMFNLAEPNGVQYFAREGRPGWGVVSWWNARQELEHIIRTQRPTTLLIELGGNDWNKVNRADYPSFVNELWNFIVQIMDEINEGGWKIIWISPARAVGNSANIQERRQAVADIILEVVGRENYIDSTYITGNFGRTPDGLHFTYAGGQDWASQVWLRIVECVRYQINR